MNNKNIIKWLPVIIGICAMLLALNACTVYRQPQMKITSVLAVTAEGDTLQLPIDVIRPIYNYNTYPRSYLPYNNMFYYSPNRYQPIYGQHPYRPGNNINSPNINQSGSGPNVSSPNIVTPPNPPNPARENPKRKN